MIKKILSPLAATVCLLGLASTPAFADTNADQAQVIKDLTQREAALEQKVDQLTTELQKVSVQKKKSHHKSSTNATTAAAGGTAMAAGTVQANKSHIGAAPDESRTVTLKGYTPVQVLTDQPLYVGGTPVVSSPYIGVRSEFNGSELISNPPTTVNLDLRLLDQRKQIDSIYSQLGLPAPSHPVIDLSGELQGLAYGTSQPIGVGQTNPGAKKSDIDVTDAELDTAIAFNPWVTGLMTINYNNAPPAVGPRVANSSFFMDRGFITIGKLDTLPWYTSIGQLYVPFGQMITSMVTNPLTKMMALVKERAVVLGYDKGWGDNNLNVSTYTFRGDSGTSGTIGRINNFGGNVDYTYAQGDDWNAGIGASYIANIADALGLQGTQAGAPSGFLGFGGGSSAIQTLVHRVPAYDLHSSDGVGNWNLLLEYLSATTSFAPTDLTFDGAGARPQAFNGEVSYNFNLFKFPSNVAVGYGFTRQALALVLPRTRYVATLNTSFWKDTVESLEFRHDINYAASDTATGGGGGSVVVPGLGSSSNTVTLEVSAYF